jgi:hypothetical protein
LFYSFKNKKIAEHILFRVKTLLINTPFREAVAPVELLEPDIFTFSAGNQLAEDIKEEMVLT